MAAAGGSGAGAAAVGLVRTQRYASSVKEDAAREETEERELQLKKEERERKEALEELKYDLKFISSNNILLIDG